MLIYDQWCFAHVVVTVCGSQELKSSNNWQLVFTSFNIGCWMFSQWLFQDAKVEDFVPLPTVEPFSTVQIITDAAQSVVPQTMGKRRKPFDEVGLGLHACVSLA